METQLTENNLLELRKRMISLFDECINNHKPSTTITLLVGLTGAGKSTIFNFLCGAEFVYNGRQLELKQNSDQFSIMKGGMVSVTKEPKFYMNNNNKHLLIDFPGFQDTTGNVDQLLFDLLFNKIVSMGEVKIIYVINNPNNNLPTRGTDLQAFISQLDNPHFNLLLNCYNDDLDDEELINDIKEQLKQTKFQSNIDKIIVQRKGKRDNLDEVFKDNHRQIFWNQIQAMNKVQIKPRNIPKSQLISEFLISEATNKIQENVKIMQDFFNIKSDETNQQQNDDMLADLKIFKDLMQNDKNLTALQWFEQFINICEKLTNSGKQQQTKIGKDFISLFQYFEQFKEFINGYQLLQTINEFGKQAFKQIEILIDTKIELIEKLKQAEEERLKAEQEKQKAEEDARKEKQERQKAEKERQKAEQDAIKEKQERQKAEQDAIKEKQERQKAEEERQRTEEKRRAEENRWAEEKRRAEQDRQRQQTEIDSLNRQYKLQEEKIRMQQRNLEEQQTKMENQQKQMQQESKRNLEEQQRREIENKQIQERERLKIEQEQKHQLIKKEREAKVISESVLYKASEYSNQELNMRLDILIAEKNKYINEQFELRNSLFGGADWWWVYYSKIGDYEREIQYILDHVNFHWMQLEYSSHD
ncbi:unnamed protein product (macronuclear) [Paramecium tetraurelia]|uniref:Uncharacterized protein n=1 Tax=Paramecium tetraurelia TaxID=5888 RepID=A0D9X6_PARTE|nr:uncharacterized protein GSPATT00014775001 [Paramecium tetraurelia]CAK79843.1 unnamed protein product [Paramecium tetraurelia]|eukprot:XP_001447240.1 hypothetical protein (macronuclear) [Paramecium tetraurelia strain d4-2]